MMTFLQTVALVGGTVHPMTPGSEPGLATLLIEGDRISAVGLDVEVPEDATRVDVTGLHLVPGLIDGAVHYDPEHDPLYLSAGVTLVRDTGNDLGAILVQRLPEARELGPGPDLLIAGQVLDGPAGALVDGVVLSSAEEARTRLPALLAQLEEGGQALDFLSIRESLPPDAWRVVLGLARQAGLDVWGPKPNGVTFQDFLRSGQAGMFGFQAMLPPGALWGDLDAERLTADVEGLVAAQLATTPLLGVYRRMLLPRDERPIELASLSPHYEVRWLDELQGWRADLAAPEVRAGLEQSLAAQHGVLRLLHQAGAPLLPGTGTPNSWLVPGSSLVDELEEWATAGLSPADVLHAATAGAAEVLGVSATRGTLAPGLVADVVALGLDPRTSVEALRDPELVVLRGRVIERDELNAAVIQLEDQQQAVREALAAPLEVPRPEMPEGTLVLSGISEVQAHGLRLSVEHWAVVERPDGTLAYGSRLITPATAASSGQEVHLVQEVRDNVLRRFDLLVRPGLGEVDPDNPLLGVVSAHGRTLAEGQPLMIERQVNGQKFDAKRSTFTLAGIASSPTCIGLLAARHFPGGGLDSYVLDFEGEQLLPMVDHWRLRMQEDLPVCLIATARGWHQFAARADGEPVLGASRVGNSFTRLVPVEVTVHREGGLGLRPERAFVDPPDQGAAPVEAGVGRDGR